MTHLRVFLSIHVLLSSTLRVTRMGKTNFWHHNSASVHCKLMSAVLKINVAQKLAKSMSGIIVVLEFCPERATF